LRERFGAHANPPRSTAPRRKRRESWASAARSTGEERVRLRHVGGRRGIRTLGTIVASKALSSARRRLPSSTRAGRKYVNRSGSEAVFCMRGVAKALGGNAIRGPSRQKPRLDVVALGASRGGRPRVADAAMPVRPGSIRARAWSSSLGTMSASRMASAAARARLGHTIEPVRSLRSITTPTACTNGCGASREPRDATVRT
jgi:hypothetical protein